MSSEGDRDVSPPNFTSFGTLGGSNTFGETVTSKRSGKIPSGDRPDSPESGISTGAEPVGLFVCLLMNYNVAFDRTNVMATINARQRINVHTMGTSKPSL